MNEQRTSLVIIMACIGFQILAAPKCLGQITPPEDFLGFKPGADFHLIDYAQAIGYFELLASQTERMQVFDMGATSSGRRMKYAVISSAENMARLERYREINRSLSLVRGISSAQADELAGEGKVIVWIDGGLHGTEVAPAQLLPQLAYELVAQEDRRTQAIRRDVITLLVFANPDGMTIVSDWYMGNVGTPYEVSPLPWLYHKYVGHDNNRDSYMANLLETQNMNRATCSEWFPEILYNQHQTGPFPARIWIPPDAEPTNPNVHPLIVRWKNLIGAAMGRAFDEADQPGAISRIRYDTWFPGYATQVVDGHNTISILTETQLYRYATPQFFSINDFPEAHRDLVRGVFYPNPWEGGWWRLGDAVAYNRTACFAVLETAARYRYELLLNKWRMGHDIIERFKDEPPYGWIFPIDQKDAHSATLLLNRLLLNGVEVYRAEEDFENNGITYKRGSHIIPAGQPFALFAKNLLEKQDYPDLRKYAHLWQGIVGTAEVGNEPLRAYDGVGWTLPLQLGVTCREMSKKLDVKMVQVQEVAVSTGALEGNGPQLVFSPANNGSFLAVNRILASGGEVSVALAEFDLGGRHYEVGSFVVAASSISREELNRIVEDTGVTMQGGRVRVRVQVITGARIGLYKSWVANMDAGWISLLLERYEFPFKWLTDAEVKAGSLRDRFDILLLPDQGSRSIIEGHRKGTISPDYIGGITLDGVVQLKKFVEQGGTLVCHNGSSELAIEHFNLPVRDILRDVKADSFSCPGSILKMHYDSTQRLAFGVDEEGIAFFSEGSAFEIVKDTLVTDKRQEKKSEAKKDESPKKDKPPPPKYAKVTPRIVAHYPQEGLLLSGWVLGDKLLRGKTAVLDVPYESGRIILFGFNVHNRMQAYATAKLLFNALYF